jgi:hypothetical protein
MPYIILKHTTINGSPRTILVNDSEGISMEFTTFESASKLAELFQANSTSGNIYEIKELK